MGYSITKNIDKGYFKLSKNQKSNHTINYLLNDFNLNEYHILKCSNKFRFIDVKDIDKYSGVIFFNKNICSKEDIDKWLEFINDFDYRLIYLHKPFPPNKILDKIKVVEWNIR